MASPGASPPILRRLLEAAGYRLDDRPAGLLAVRGRDRRGVFLVDGPRSPAEVEGEFPPDLIHRILVYEADPGAVARELASAKGIEIIDESSLGPALGELLLPGPEGAAETSSPYADLEPPAQVFPEGERTVRPRLGRRDAEALAGFDGFRYTLRLVPFYVAPYRVRPATAHGVPGVPSDHLVGVNALTKQVEIWEPNERELVPELDEPSQRLAPAISESEALAIAEAAIRRRHTVSVDHSEQQGGALIVERRRIPPGAGDVKIGTAVLVHVPYWYVEGSEGRVVLDAVTGARALPAEPDPS
jgi:hypothetical protein